MFQQSKSFIKIDAISFKLMNQEFVKIDKFDGNNFNRWQDKMKFLLTALKILYILDPSLPPIPDDPVQVERDEGQSALIETLK